MISGQYLKYIDHVCRRPKTTLTKKMLFAKSRRRPLDKYRKIIECLHWAGKEFYTT